jgi:hypothetical protein
MDRSSTPSSVLPYIPAQVSDHSVHRNAGVDNFRYQLAFCAWLKQAKGGYRRIKQYTDYGADL